MIYRVRQVPRLSRKKYQKICLHLAVSSRKKVEVVGKFAIPGQFLGVDSGEEAVELFYIAGNVSEPEVRTGLVNSKLDGLKNTQALYFLPWNSRNLPVRGWETGTRGYRLRGLKQGDLRKFVTQVMSHPGYWIYEDISSLQFTLGWNPLAWLSSMNRQHLTTSGRL